MDSKILLSGKADFELKKQTPVCAGWLQAVDRSGKERGAAALQGTNQEKIIQLWV